MTTKARKTPTKRVKPKRVSVVGLPYQQPIHGLSDYKPEFAETALKLCRDLGATDRDLADVFQVTITTIWNWQGRYKEFATAMKLGKESADDRVVRSLYMRATGYTFDSEKIVSAGDGDYVRVKTREHIPPDTTACIFWLKNRRSKEWRDKTEHDLTLNIRQLGENIPVDEAQSSFRQIRGATAELLEKELKTIDGEFVRVEVAEDAK